MRAERHAVLRPPLRLPDSPVTTDTSRLQNHAIAAQSRSSIRPTDISRRAEPSSKIYAAKARNSTKPT